MAVALIVNESRLQMHFRQSGRVLASAVHRSAQLQVEADFVNSGVIGGLYGPGCERISRNRGRSASVAPLLCLGQGLWVWLGYHEEWAGERPNRRIRRYSFRSVGLSIYFGLRNNVLKPQMFRAEWAGWARWGRGDYSLTRSIAFLMTMCPNALRNCSVD